MKPIKVHPIVLTIFFAIAILVGFSINDKTEITRSTIEQAEKIFGVEFIETKRDSMLDELNDNLKSFKKLREIKLENSIMPSLLFNPIPQNFSFEKKRIPFKVDLIKTRRPENLEDAAFYSIPELAYMIKNRLVTSLELTEVYLQRLKRFGSKLECIVTLTEELAIEQAKRADDEISKGKYRGLLHGIPYGIKDLFSTKKYKTTWGAPPFKDQLIDEDAEVVKRLEKAGAVLVAKLSMGELAWGETWFGGFTRNPWNLEQGSSGSSAGSAAATASGLVAFAIGTETWGSIISPATRCGVTGLRPTYGRVSRSGAMALSWSMDKIGPICRTAEDCAIVFNAIYGPDNVDPTLFNLPFNYNQKADLKNIRVGYIKSEFDKERDQKKSDDEMLQVLRALGVQLKPIELPDLPVSDLSFILSTEAAAAFDELIRSGREDDLVRQIKNSWPNVLRAHRFVPAVEYIQANRIRTILINEMQKIFDEIDVYVVPTFGGSSLLLTNLTGHPSVVVPNGFNEKGGPTSISFVGKLFGEADVLAIAKKYQEATEFHKKHPRL
ncbi:MAG: amidase [Bacteroidetes bacterium]|nr:amidase [Bacteroidota bacterium]